MIKKKLNISSSGWFNALKLKLSVFAGAFMLPISTLAITSLFLAFGALLESTGNAHTVKALSLLGHAIKSIAYPILHALPLLLAIAFAVVYTKNNALAIWCTVICYLVFIYFQSSFIHETTSGSVVFRKYIVLFPGLGRSSTLMSNLVHRVFGANTLNTSFFGSVIIGAIVIPYVFKNYSDVQLPKYLAFFSGKRFLPLASALAAVPLAACFLVYWPYIGMAMNQLGIWIAKTPYGIDSFLFGFLERIMVPFGLHHAFYSPLWYSSLGGDVLASAAATTSSTLATATTSSGSSSSSTPEHMKTLFTGTEAAKDYMQAVIHKGLSPFTSWQGDSFMGISTIALPGNQINSKPVFEHFATDLKLNVGRFTGGKYPAMQFGLPAAGLAMLYAAPQDKRKQASLQIIPAMLTSCIIGMTEPMEFMFLYIAPKLFFGVHAVLMGLSFMLMNVFGTHVGTAFSGGFIEFVIFGIIPHAKGTKWFMWLPVGLILAPLYFTSFYLYITTYNVPTPGREHLVDGATTTESTHEEETSTSEVPTQTRKLAIALGGWDNVVSPTNCASRLRYTIQDKALVDEDGLKKAGAMAVKWIGDTHLQIIVGLKAESINAEFVKWKGTDLGVALPAISTTTETSSASEPTPPELKDTLQRPKEESN